MSRKLLTDMRADKLGLSRAELSQARACLEVINLNNFFELSTYHLKVTLSFFGLGSEIFVGLGNQEKNLKCFHQFSYSMALFEMFS